MKQSKKRQDRNQKREEARLERFRDALRKSLGISPLASHPSIAPAECDKNCDDSWCPYTH